MKWTVGIVISLIVLSLIIPLFAQREWVNAEVKYGQSKTLVIILHAYAGNEHSLDNVKEVILENETFYGADVLQPGIPIGVLSIESPHKIIARLLLEVDKAWEKRKAEGRPYENVVVIGHSLGAILARKLYVAAHGEHPDAPFEQELKAAVENLGGAPLTNRREWTHQKTRIVLLAGMNRGWSISHHMSIWRAIYMQAGVAWSYVMEVFYNNRPLIMEMRRGAPFITQLRLQWLAMEQAAIKPKDTSPHQSGATDSNSSMQSKLNNLPEVVQLLGTVDDLVSPDDNLDLIVGGRFRYLSVPYSGHANVVMLKDCRDYDDFLAQKGVCDYENSREDGLKLALTISPNSPDDLEFERQKIQVLPEVKDVVFVIHGIRDEGHWTKQIARRIRQKFENQNAASVVATETSTYGYFPMLSFLVPGERQEKVEWFMDRYVETRALYPNANFHFVGHSHGTYLFAKALKDYSSVSFDRVVFAGSVVHKRYEWEEFRGTRVNAILNYVATGDWVVAFFPKALQSLRLQDLGSAGHDGFIDRTVVQPESLYVRGGHSAALGEAIWDSIAEFIVTGNFKEPPDSAIAKSQSKWVVYPARVAPLIWVVIAIILLGILWFLTKLRFREWQKTIAILAYLFLIWTVLTRV